MTQHYFYMAGIGLLACGLLTAGCKPDETPFKAENESLKKQVSRQESLLSSLQDGNKIMQQQIDLLNHELRDAKKATESAKAEMNVLSSQLEAQLAQAKRLTADAHKAAATQAAQQLRVEEKGAQSETLSQPLTAIAKAVEEALTRNGYPLKVSFKSEQRAVYVTERKISTPVSLEVTGSRNQYLITLQSRPDKTTTLNVRAEFEKVAQGGRILSVSQEETAEIEQRLIGEIRKALAPQGKA